MCGRQVACLVTIVVITLFYLISCSIKKDFHCVIETVFFNLISSHFNVIFLPLPLIRFCVVVASVILFWFQVVFVPNVASISECIPVVSLVLSFRPSMFTCWMPPCVPQRAQSAPFWKTTKSMTASSCLKCFVSSCHLVKNFSPLDSFWCYASTSFPLIFFFNEAIIAAAVDAHHIRAITGYQFWGMQNKSEMLRDAFLSETR